MRNVVRLRRNGQSSGTAGYDGSSESSSSSDSSEYESDSNFEDENVVESSESSHETGSSEFEEAEALEDVQEESDHLEGMSFFHGVGAYSPAFSDPLDWMYGEGNEFWAPMDISSSDVEIIEPPPPEVIEISSDSTVAVNIIDISSRETSPFIPMPSWSPFSLGGSLDFSMESFGQTSDPYYDYHYAPLPSESPPVNQEVGPENEEADMEVQQEARGEDQRLEDTQSGAVKESGEPSRDAASDLGQFAVCTSCVGHGHLVVDCPVTRVVRTVPISVVPPASPARSSSSATGGSNRRNRNLGRNPRRGAR